MKVGAKEYLQSYRRLERTIEQKRWELAALQQSVSGIREYYYSGREKRRPKGGRRGRGGRSGGVAQERAAGRGCGGGILCSLLFATLRAWADRGRRHCTICRNRRSTANPARLRNTS